MLNVEDYGSIATFATMAGGLAYTILRQHRDYVILTERVNTLWEAHEDKTKALSDNFDALFDALMRRGDAELRHKGLATRNSPIVIDPDVIKQIEASPLGPELKALYAKLIAYNNSIGRPVTTRQLTMEIFKSLDRSVVEQVCDTVKYVEDGVEKVGLSEMGCMPIAIMVATSGKANVDQPDSPIE